MRILVAFEDEYRSYRGAIADAIRMHRPRVEVAAVGLGALGEEVARFDPHLVVCSQPNTVDPNGRPAWFQLPTDPLRSGEICLDGQRSKEANPDLEKLLWVVDETEKLLHAKLDPGNC